MTDPAAAARPSVHPVPAMANGPKKKVPRLAAGRARALGVPTRGTTAPNRLRRVDRWMVGTQASVLRSAADPLAVDLGYGATGVTTIEWSQRLRAIRPDVRMVGLEIDPDRVAAARASVAAAKAAETALAGAADANSTALVAANSGVRSAARAGVALAHAGLVHPVEFRRGGFEFAGLRPTVVRAMNVLRQYDEPAAAGAWETMLAGLAPGGILVEGTCCERGRIGTWITLDATGPRHLTLAAKLSTLDKPATLAERLPKALIHHNVPGRRVHAFFDAFTGAWAASAALAAYGNRQRWIATAAKLTESGWPILDRHPRWRLGEITVAWSAISP